MYSSSGAGTYIQLHSFRIGADSHRQISPEQRAAHITLARTSLVRCITGFFTAEKKKKNQTTFGNSIRSRYFGPVLFITVSKYPYMESLVSEVPKR